MSELARKKSNSLSRSQGPERLEPRYVLSGNAVVISEFMASNRDTLLDADMDSSDWLELQNRSEETVSLNGWHLTDDVDEPSKWELPNLELEPDQLLLLFASGKNRRSGDEFHTNFKLSAGGEYLALSDESGQVQASFGAQYPPQTADVSYGISNLAGDPPALRYFSDPTPNAPNGLGDQLGGEINVSHDSGFYESTIEVTLSSTEPDGSIRYTTDGAVPTESEGIAYSGPISVQGSTVIRAAVFAEGFESSQVVTRSFLFLSDVLAQSNETALERGFPVSLGRGPANYAMNSNIIGPNDRFDGKYAATIRDDLLAVPTLSLVMDPDDFYGSEGIYTNPDGRGIEWERAVAGEIFAGEILSGENSAGENLSAADGTAVQFEAGIRIQGGISRSLSAKKSLRLIFRSEYGQPTLKHPVFGEDVAEEHNSIALRGSGGEGFVGVHYIRDPYVRSTHAAMGQASPNGQHLHVYINGLYWGVYEAVERPDAQFMSNYYGGDKDHWDVINAGNLGDEKDTAVDGDLAAWERLLAQASLLGSRRESQEEKEAIFLAIQGLYPDGSRNPEQEVLLDVDNYIDYLITNWSVGNRDWPHRNYYMGRDRSENSTGFKFVVWDAEFTLENFECSQVRSFSERLGPGALSTLFNTEGFRVRFSDRVQQHFSFGGALYVNPEMAEFQPGTPENNAPVKRYADIVDSFRAPIVPESARWNESFFGGEVTRDENWAIRVQQHFGFLDRQAEAIPTCLRQLDYYRPAPEFADPEHVLAADDLVTFASNEDPIYVTLDGTDPRNPDGSVNEEAFLYTTPFSLEQSAQVQARVLEDAEWSGMQHRTFLVQGQNDPTSLRVSEIHYHPALPSSAELDMGFTDGDDFEFVELVNTSSATISLAGFELVQASPSGLESSIAQQETGVDFRFNEGRIQELGAGEAVLVVEDVAAFQARYGTDLPVAGQWSGKLDNKTETLTLSYRGLDIQQVTYHDVWYPDTDGGGFSLETTDVQQADLQQWSRQAGWTASDAMGGSPGSFGQQAAGDFDGDGLVNADDVDALYAAISSEEPEAQFDLNEDDQVDRQDLVELVTGPILNTHFGDANLDGAVDFQDFLVLSTNFGSNEAGWGTADFDGNGLVDFEDFLPLTTNFGQRRM